MELSINYFDVFGTELSIEASMLRHLIPRSLAAEPITVNNEDGTQPCVFRFVASNTDADNDTTSWDYEPVGKPNPWTKLTVWND